MVFLKRRLKNSFCVDRRKINSNPWHVGPSSERAV